MGAGGSNSDSGGEWAADFEHSMALLRRQAESLKTSPKKGIYWANSKHSFVVTVSRKVVKQFHMRKRLADLNPADYVDCLIRARDGAVNHFTMLEVGDLLR